VFALLVFVTVYLVLGRLLYVRRWPQGLFPKHIDPERERWRRQKRTRVLSLDEPVARQDD
jgi:hypothetical protein